MDQLYTSSQIKVMIRSLFEEVKHGDQEHQDWLKKKMYDFIEEKLGKINLQFSMTFETLAKVAELTGQRTILVAVSADEFHSLAHEEYFTKYAAQGRRPKLIDGLGGNVTIFRLAGATICIKIDTEL